MKATGRNFSRFFRELEIFFLLMYSCVILIVMADAMNTGLTYNFNFNLRDLLSTILVDGRKTVDCIKPRNESIFNNALAEICAKLSIGLGDIKLNESLPPLRAKLNHLHRANENARSAGGTSWIRFCESLGEEIYVWPVTFKSSVLL